MILCIEIFSLLILSNFYFGGNVAISSTGCSGKNVFFHNSLQPLPRLHRCCMRPTKLSTQCECTVTPIGWQFFVQPIAAECWLGRGGKLSRILGEKTQSLMNTLYMYSLLSLYFIYKAKLNVPINVWTQYNMTYYNRTYLNYAMKILCKFFIFKRP